MIYDWPTQEEVYRQAAQMLKQKLPEKEIMEHLTNCGLDRYYAEIILENVKNDAEDKKQFWKNVLSGSFVFISGLILSIGTYRLAAPGGFYCIFSGIMLVGIISVIKGYILFRK